MLKKIKKIMPASYKIQPVWIFMVLTSFFMVATVYFYVPSKVVYGYDSSNCVTKLTLFPGAFKDSTQNVSVEYQSTITALGVDFAATKSCLLIEDLPKEGSQITVSQSFLGFKLVAQRYILQADNYPDLSVKEQQLRSVPVNGSLDFELSVPDNLFKYSLVNKEFELDCNNNTTKVSCNVGELDLKHATDYKASVVRSYQENTIPVAHISFKTVEPISVTATTLPANGVVTSPLAEVTIETDKEIAQLGDIELVAGDNKYKVAASFSGSKITIILPADLPRDANYTVLIGAITGTNKETLTAPYKTGFYLSPGPKVTGWSLGDRKTPRSGVFTLNFDQQLGQQDINSVLKLYQDDTPISFNATIRGSTVNISPTSQLNTCASYRAVLSGNIVNNYGIPKSQQWTATSRVECSTAFRVGTSVQGRVIMGYSYGNGSKEVLYIGAVHGNEKNSKAILDKWMYEVEGNPGRIPAGTKVTVIPLVNPDGYAKSSRYNANNVDLNRNFAANNWKADVTVQGGSVMVNGGGTAPLSEPESSAIATYISSRRPALVLTYHSQGNIVESNEGAGANGYAQTYANLSKYAYTQGSSNGEFFAYDINGSLEQWAKDKLNQPVVLIELRTKTGDDFSRNKEAMWAML
jgi:predicted deacylase